MRKRTAKKNHGTIVTFSAKMKERGRISSVVHLFGLFFTVDRQHDFVTSVEFQYQAYGVNLQHRVVD